MPLFYVLFVEVAPSNLYIYHNFSPFDPQIIKITPADTYLYEEVGAYPTTCAPSSAGVIILISDLGKSKAVYKRVYLFTRLTHRTFV